MFEVHTKGLCTFIFITIYGSMLYSYFLDETHIVLMENLSRLGLLVLFTFGVSFFLPVIIHKYIMRGNRSHYQKWFIMFTN